VALQFDGISSYIECGTDAGLLGEVLTVMGHVFASGDVLDGFVTFQNSGTRPDIYTNWFGRGMVYLGNSNWRYFLASAPPSGQWSHVAFKVTGFGINDIDNSEYLLNGVQQTPEVTTKSGTPQSPSGFKIGVAKNLADISSSILAEVSLWNRNLSDDEIRHYMYRKLTGGESGLVGYWPMDDAGSGTGVSIKDISGGGNVGTMGGFSGNPWRSGPQINRGMAS